MTILVRGSSIAAGKGVSESYTGLLCRSGILHGEELINRSRQGETSFDCVWTFYKDIAPFMPKVLILHFGIDDAFYPVYRSEFKENLVQTVRLARHVCSPYIMIMTSQPFEDQYDMDAVNIYYRTIREVCIDLECEMVPVHTWWQGVMIDRGQHTSEYVLTDTRLPNQKGHEIFASCLGSRIEKYLQNIMNNMQIELNR